MVRYSVRNPLEWQFAAGFAQRMVNTSVDIGTILRLCKDYFYGNKYHAMYVLLQPY